jgi:ribose-phosphate pyrophosphokinase
MQVFSGSSNEGLAEGIAEKLGVSLGKVEMSRFANDEARVFVVEEKVEREVVVVQSLSQPTDHHLIEFCLLCDALKRKGAREITAMIPWLGYSKQDKVFRPGEPLSVKVIANLLQTVHLEKIITFDLHNLAILGFFDIPVLNLSAKELFLEYLKPKLTDKSVVVAPDAGAVKLSTAFAMELNVPVAYIDKARDLETGRVTIKDINREVKGARVMILDDMVVTGSTLLEVSAFLGERQVESITVAATHHLYVPGAQDALDRSVITEVVVTDTVKNKSQSEKLRVLSVAAMVADALR